MLLFKATNGDLALAFFVGIFGYLAAEYVGRRTTTPYFKEATGAFVVAILAELLVSIGIVPAILLLVPSCRWFLGWPSPMRFGKFFRGKSSAALFAL